MKILSRHKILVALFSILLMACEDPIDWDVNSDQIKLVVEGRVTNEFINQQVKLTQTADYFSSASPRMVEGAQVVVSDGESTYNYEELQPGIYTSVNAFAGVIGRSYSIDIQLSSPLGESTAFTASSTMLPPMTLDSLFNKKEATFDDTGEVSEDSLYLLGFYGQEVVGFENGYFFDVFVNDFKETDNVVNLGIFDDNFLEDDYLEDFLIYEVEEGNPGDSITMVLYSVEREYVTFLDALVAEIEGAEPLGFSGPPANVVGNFSNGGLGYFYTAAVDTSYTVLID
ncbi:MAG: DUF4249 family protein [Cyclobacteriaceae bacterium]